MSFAIHIFVHCSLYIPPTPEERGQCGLGIVAKPGMTKQRIITLMMTLPGDADFKLLFSAFAQYTPTWMMLKLLERKT